MALHGHTKFSLRGSFPGDLLQCQEVTVALLGSQPWSFFPPPRQNGFGESWISGLGGFGQEEQVPRAGSSSVLWGQAVGLGVSPCPCQALSIHYTPLPEGVWRGQCHPFLILWIWKLELERSLTGAWQVSAHQCHCCSSQGAVAPRVLQLPGCCDSQGAMAPRVLQQTRVLWLTGCCDWQGAVAGRVLLIPQHKLFASRSLRRQQTESNTSCRWQLLRRPPWLPWEGWGRG